MVIDVDEARGDGYPDKDLEAGWVPPRSTMVVLQRRDQLGEVFPCLLGLHACERLPMLHPEYNKEWDGQIEQSSGCCDDEA